jgi:uroporphyrinogen-III synthase
MGTELAALVERYGGIVRSAPAVLEAPLDCADIVADLLVRLETPARRMYVFLTGAGAAALLQEAERQERLPFVIDALKRGTIVCRGPKPTAALKRYGLTPHVTAASPFTSHAMLDAMVGLDLSDAEVTVVHYGERSEALAEALQMRGGALNELCVYEWRLPQDVGPLQELARDVVKREVDAVIFTSQVQWKHLLHVASGMGLADAVIHALGDVVVAAVGPICSAALADAGVHPQVVPDNPKMGPLVAALAEYFEQNPEPRTRTPAPRTLEPRTARSTRVAVESSLPACVPDRAGPIPRGG